MSITLVKYRERVYSDSRNNIYNMTLEYIVQREREAFHLLYGNNPSKEIRDKFAKAEKDFISESNKKK